MARTGRVKSKPQKKESIIFDTSGLINQNKQTYANRPFVVSFQVLKGLADNYDIARACINTLKHTVTRMKWHIVPIDKKKPFSQKDADRITELLENPNHYSDSSFRSLMDRAIEDLLTIDQVYLEVVRDSYGEVVELYNLDGTTIKPNFTIYGEPVAYKQYVEKGKSSANADAVFKPEDILVTMQNPRTGINKYGYGMSPIESVINTVTSAINANLYNTKFFDQSTVPPMIINFKGTIQKEQLEEFARYWQAMLSGNQWKTAMMNSEGAEVMKIRDNNQDMQFMEYILWMAKVTIAAFEMSPQDIGLTMDVNKATGDTQARLSKSQGIASILNLMEELFNIQLIRDKLGIENCKFEWEEIDVVDENTQALINQIYITTGVKSINEVRQGLGYDPIDEGDDHTSMAMQIKTEKDKPSVPTEKSQKKKYESIHTLKELKESLYDNWN